MSDPENEGKGFKVTDRRKFTSEGQLREEAEDSPEPSPQRAPSMRPSDATALPSAGAIPRHATEAFSEATFLDLVGMLATNAMLQLGDMPNPASGERVENLQAVQDMIAFLEILQQKTKGNLTEQEGGVLEQVLYDLRMRYMAKAKILNV
ncbi:MAG: DUF1844 domain-containing protein [Vicinamibacteria bacterium]